jgi:hypothetical protein
MNRQLLAAIFYGVGILSIGFVVVRTYLRLRRLRKDQGFVRKKVSLEEAPQRKY